MPFAANGKIAEEGFEGAIEITREEYSLALEGLLKGWALTIDDGFKVLLPVGAEPEASYEPSAEQIKSRTLEMRDGLLAIAAIRIAPLQDGVDLDEAQEEELALSKKWKQYRIALNRIDQQPAFPLSVDWPMSPA